MFFIFIYYLERWSNLTFPYFSDGSTFNKKSGFRSWFKLVAKKVLVQGSSLIKNQAVFDWWFLTLSCLCCCLPLPLAWVSLGVKVGWVSGSKLKRCKPEVEGDVPIVLKGWLKSMPGLVWTSQLQTPHGLFEYQGRLIFLWRWKSTTWHISKPIDDDTWWS